MRPLGDGGSFQRMCTWPPLSSELGVVSAVMLRESIVSALSVSEQMLTRQMPLQIIPVHPAFGCSLGQAVQTHVPLSPSSINLVPAQAGKVTVGLASDWPCVTVPSTRTEFGKCSFRVAAPRTWNSLPLHLRSPIISWQQFQSGLKTHLFKRAYIWLLPLRTIEEWTYLLTY